VTDVRFGYGDFIQSNSGGATENGEMKYRVRQEDDGYAILILRGDVRKQILECLDNGSHLLVDMSAVNYIDSSGVASLVEGYQTARKKALRFGLVGVSSAAMNVLHLARLDRVFPIHASIAEGKAAGGTSDQG
jgi:anti-sigma B factor antagonist